MIQLVFVLLGLRTPAFAADIEDQALDGFEGSFAAGPLKDAAKKAKEDLEKDKTEAEKEADARLAELEAARAKKAARVVVLRWPNTTTDYETEALVRNIKVRIARPDAKFYPEIDLYQNGRREWNKDIRPLDQRATVDVAIAPTIDNMVFSTLSIPWNGLPEQEWGLKANELRDLLAEIWFIDRPELREPIYKLYAAIGYAAENRNNPSPPYYDAIARSRGPADTVNYYWYLAGAMAHETPELLSVISSNEDIIGSIRAYKESIDDGYYAPMTLSFEDAGQWNAEKFTADYKVFINGVEQQILHPKGLYDAVAGRADVYLMRSDSSHSLSDRVELERLEEKVYQVRDTARIRMGGEFIDMLTEHPNECSPELEGDILVYLAIYQKLHPEAELYIAVPEAGSVNRILLWRYKKTQGTLERVQDNTGGFPVRFVSLVGVGAIFSGFAPPITTPPEPAEPQPGDDPAAAGAGATDLGEEFLANLEPKPNMAGLPILYHMRGHYGRLMVTFGVDYAAKIAGDGPWAGRYQTDRTSKSAETKFGDQFTFQEGVDWEEAHQVATLGTNPWCDIATFLETNPEPDTPDDEDTTFNEADWAAELADEEGDSDITTAARAECTANPIVSTEVYRYRTWQRLVFTGVGVVLLQDAAIGFGPRAWVRFGWYNVPHGLDLTGHVGWALEPLKPPADAKVEERVAGRVRFIVDTDFYLGAMIPFRDYAETLWYNKKQKPAPKLTFGANAAAGLTF